MRQSAWSGAGHGCCRFGGGRGTAERANRPCKAGRCGSARFSLGPWAVDFVHPTRAASIPVQVEIELMALTPALPKGAEGEDGRGCRGSSASWRMLAAKNSFASAPGKPKPNYQKFFGSFFSKKNRLLCFDCLGSRPNLPLPPAQERGSWAAWLLRREGLICSCGGATSALVSLKSSSNLNVSVAQPLSALGFNGFTAGLARPGRGFRGRGIGDVAQSFPVTVRQRAGVGTAGACRRGCAACPAHHRGDAGEPFVRQLLRRAALCAERPVSCADIGRGLRVGGS